MNVLHVIGNLDPDSGGPPMIAASLAAAQAALGHQVTVAAPAYQHRRKATDKALSGIPGMDRVNVVGLPPPTGLELLMAHKARRILRPLIEKAQVVHLHSVWESVLRVAAVEARRIRRPYFILLNGMLDSYSMAQRAWKKKLALMLGYRKMFNGAAALHLGNRDEEQLIKPLGLHVPGVIVPNGIFVEQIDPLPAPGTFRRAHPQVGDHPYILFFSRLHHKKGLDYLADAFVTLASRQDKVHLVVAGPDGGAQADFERRIAAAGLQHRVHLTGPLYGPGKFAAMVDALCFCLPSRQEGFSMAITEALATGLPVICTTNCHYPEVAQAQAGMVTPLDVKALAEAMEQLVTDADLRQRMGQAARQLVLSRFTWPKIAQMSLDMYQPFL